jgi:hypothetical protein
VLDQLFNVEGVVSHGTTAESVEAAIAYLANWDYGDGEDEGTIELHDVVAESGPYVLTAHLGLRHIGLYRRNEVRVV